MEEDARLKKIAPSKIVEQRLEEAVEKAQNAIDREVAESPELRYALEIVERFLIRKKRVCYGGTAMNAQLPEALKFYDSAKDLPDYDFFTPELETDVAELLADLKRAGFDEVAQRIGMHEGTKKILVNYVAVADISEMDPAIYETLQIRSVVIKGIHYTDPDILRMMMYLELSRPKGEVSRWTKVYERLNLMNKAFPMERCEKEQRKPLQIPIALREVLHKFCIDNKRILAGARLEKLYAKALRGNKPVTWETREGGAVVFYSPNPKEDALLLRKKLGFRGFDIEYFKPKGDLIPTRLVIRLNKTPIALIIQETACHAYNTLQTTDEEQVFIASLDTLITLYLSLAIFTDDEDKIFRFSLLCATERFITVNTLLQKAKKINQFLPFPLECRGYQKGYPTLVREKVARIGEERAAAKIQALLGRAKTLKRKTTARRVTRNTRITRQFKE